MAMVEPTAAASMAAATANVAALAVETADMAFEEELARGGAASVKLWLRYVAHKRTAPRAARNAVFERALRQLPGSYKLWYLYLRVRAQRCSWARIGGRA